MQIINGFDVNTRERVLDPEDVNSRTEFWNEVRATPIWKEFVRTYGATQNNVRRIENVLAKHDGEYLTFNQFIDTLTIVVRSGGEDSDPLDRRVMSPEPDLAPIVPTDKDGRPLSASQIAWGEMTRWSETASSAQIAERRRSDPAFPQFYSTNLRREFEGVGDAATDLNARPQSSSTRVTPELAAWVDAYRRMPASEVRKKARADCNPAGYVQWNAMLNLAIKNGLI